MRLSYLFTAREPPDDGLEQISEAYITVLKRRQQLHEHNLKIAFNLRRSEDVYAN